MYRPAMAWPPEDACQAMLRPMLGYLFVTQSAHPIRGNREHPARFPLPAVMRQ